MVISNSLVLSDCTSPFISFLGNISNVRYRLTLIDFHAFISKICIVINLADYEFEENKKKALDMIIVK